MAIKSLSSPLTFASNNIVAIGKRSRNPLSTTIKEYNGFLNFLDLKINEIESIPLPNLKKLQEISEISLTKRIGDSNLFGGMDLFNSIEGRGPKSKDKLLGGKGRVSVQKEGSIGGNNSFKRLGAKLKPNKIGRMASAGPINALFTGLDFASGLSAGESLGKAAAGAGGSLAGSVAGGAIGQIFIPVPVLGYFIGSAIGGFLGGYTADRVVDSIGNKETPIQYGTLRKELDVKIAEGSKKQATIGEVKSSKSFKQSVIRFSDSVDKFGEFFGISSKVLEQSSNLSPEDIVMDYVDHERDLGEQIRGEFGSMIAEGGILPSSVLGSKYGWRGGKLHRGNDYPIASGTPISVIQPGIVTRAGWFDGYGYGVQINHPGGVNSFYGHLSKINVSTGQQIIPGSVIGLVGSTGRSTGPHVHFEVDANGKSKVDPTDYADKIFRFGANVNVKPSSQNKNNTGQSIPNIPIGVTPNFQNANVSDVRNISGIVIGAGHQGHGGGGTISSSGKVKESMATLHILKALKKMVKDDSEMSKVVSFWSPTNDNFTSNVGKITKGGKEYIELHFDQRGSDIGSGLIFNSQKTTGVTRELGKAYGTFPENHRGGLGVPRAGGSILELTGIDRDSELLNEIYSGAYSGPQTTKRARHLYEAIRRGLIQEGLIPSTVSPTSRSYSIEPVSSPINYQGAMQYTSYNKPQRKSPSKVAVLDKTNIVMVGDIGKSTSIVAPTSHTEAPVLVSQGVTPNQIRNGLVELILLSSIG